MIDITTGPGNRHLQKKKRKENQPIRSRGFLENGSCNLVVGERVKNNELIN